MKTELLSKQPKPLLSCTGPEEVRSQEKYLAHPIIGTRAPLRTGSAKQRGRGFASPSRRLRSVVKVFRTMTP